MNRSPDNAAECPQAPLLDPAAAVSSLATAAGAVAARELEAACRAWSHLGERRIANQIGGWMAFMRCRTAQDLIAAQADRLCEELDLWRRGMSDASEIISRVAGDAVRLTEAGAAAIQR